MRSLVMVELDVEAGSESCSGCQHLGVAEKLRCELFELGLLTVKGVPQRLTGCLAAEMARGEPPRRETRDEHLVEEALG